MKRGILAILVLGVFMVSFVLSSEGEDLEFDGVVPSEVNLSGMNLSDEELARIYEENKDKISEEDLSVLASEVVASDIGQYVGNMSCNLLKSYFENGNVSIEIPDEIPFTDDIFTIFIDDNFLISAEIEEKNLTNIYCEIPEDTTYNIYLTSGLLVEVISNHEEINPIDFYLEKKKSGDLEIKPVGFGRKFKFFFLNLGIKIASVFI